MSAAASPSPIARLCDRSDGACPGARLCGGCPAPAGALCV